MKLGIKHTLFLIFISLAAGIARQWAPHGISWNGRWPTSNTSALDAYKMMAKPGDPAFIGLDEIIQLQEKKEAVILDARSVKDFAAGRIPGSRNLPFYELEKYQDAALEGIQEDTLVIIYCEGIGCELSFFLGRELQTSGYKNIRIFYGGYPEWSQAGLRIEK